MSRRAEKIAAIQEEQAHALQAKIDQDKAKGRLRREHWEFAKEQYLKEGDLEHLRAEAQVFYNTEPFFSLQQAIVNVAVEVAALAGERATRTILERQTPRITAVRKAAARSYGQSVTLDRPSSTPALDAELEALLTEQEPVTPEPDCE